MSKVFIFVIYLMVVSGVIVITDCMEECLKNWTWYENAGAYFKLQLTPATWNTARRQCEDLGATLASPTEHLSDPINNIVALTDTLEGIFTGIRLSTYDGDFYSVEGIRLYKIPHKWATDKGEPNNYNGQEECLVLNRNGEMEDVGCEKKYQYICYKSLQQVQKECGQGYQVQIKTCGCYKLHETPGTWNESIEICGKDGGHLAVINHDAEAEVIKEMVSTQNINSQAKKIDTISARLGFRKVEGQWLTINGESLSHAGYEVWGDGEPSTKDGKQDCGGVLLNSKELDDIECDMKYFFICEKRIL